MTDRGPQRRRRAASRCRRSAGTARARSPGTGTFAFHLPRRRAGIETPRRPSSTRYIEIDDLAGRDDRDRPPGDVAADREAKNPPSTRILSASGSRNAPERVVPSRRANQPSMPSVIQSTSQPVNVAHESAPRSSAEDHHEHRDREQQPRDRDRVRGRADRVRPERGATRRACVGALTERAAPATVDRLGDEVGTERGDGPRAHQRRRGGRARRRGGRRRRSRAPRGGCARPGRRSRRRSPSTSTSSSAPAQHERVAGGLGDRRLDVLALAQPLGRRARRATAPSSVAAGVPSSRGEREEPGPVELGGVEEREQLVVRGLRLAGEPDDERRPERGVGLRRADRRR